MTSPRRRHWGVEPNPGDETGEAVQDAPWTSAEERATARRILWRDSATILIGMILALLVLQTVLRGAGGPGPAAATPPPSGLIVGGSRAPGSHAPGSTQDSILDPSLGVDRLRTRNPTLPPTGTQRPAATPPTATPPPIVTPPPPTAPPTQPPATEPPPTPEVTPEVTPEPTPEVTPEPTLEPPLSPLPTSLPPP